MKSTPRIYAHRKRRDEWGLAILAYEREDRRGYQFQDGELRRFKEGWYHMMEQVSPPPGDAPRVVKNLKSMLKEAKAVRERTAAIETQAAQVDFESVHRIFLELFPKGFASEDYRSKIRGVDQKRRIKRHRDSAIMDARQKLSVDELHGLAEAGEYEGIRDRLIEVVGATDMVTKTQMKPLMQLDSAHFADLGNNLRTLLYGSGPHEARFERFVRVLERGDQKVSWELATAPAALVHPAEHLFVKASGFKHLVDLYAPTLGWGSRPTGWLYGRLLGLSQDIAAELEAAGDPPGDLLDVSYMVWAVMRPKYREKLTLQPIG